MTKAILVLQHLDLGRSPTSNLTLALTLLTLTFTKSVKHFVNKGSKVHCTFLDASKVFGKVFLNGLYLKLIERGAPLPFIRILTTLYTGLSVMWYGMVI